MSVVCACCKLGCCERQFRDPRHEHAVSWDAGCNVAYYYVLAERGDFVIKRVCLVKDVVGMPMRLSTVTKMHDKLLWHVFGGRRATCCRRPSHLARPFGEDVFSSASRPSASGLASAPSSSYLLNACVIVVSSLNIISPMLIHVPQPCWQGRALQHAGRLHKAQHAARSTSQPATGAIAMPGQLHQQAQLTARPTGFGLKAFTPVAGRRPHSTGAAKASGPTPIQNTCLSFFG